jgi:peptidoglycan-associated lipoprotein
MKRSALLLGCLVTLVLVAAACAKKPVIPPQPPILPPPMEEAVVPETEPTAPERPTTPTAPPPAAPAAVAVLKPVYFDFDKAEVRADNRAILEQAAAHLKANPGKYVLEGHCDQEGTEEYNRGLGLRRANAVRAELVKLGVDGGCLSVVSFGEGKPVTTNPKEFQLNRRVELAVQK